jgi:hypothetical protein
MKKEQKNKSQDFQTRINDFIKDDLISDIQFKIDNKVNFEANASSKNIVPIIIEINKY